MPSAPGVSLGPGLQPFDPYAPPTTVPGAGTLDPWAATPAPWSPPLQFPAPQCPIRPRFRRFCPRPPRCRPRRASTVTGLPSAGPAATVFQHRALRARGPLPAAVPGYRLPLHVLVGQQRQSVADERGGCEHHGRLPRFHAHRVQLAGVTRIHVAVGQRAVGAGQYRSAAAVVQCLRGWLLESPIHAAAECRTESAHGSVQRFSELYGRQSALHRRRCRRDTADSRDRPETGSGLLGSQQDQAVAGRRSIMAAERSDAVRSVLPSQTGASLEEHAQRRGMVVCRRRVRRRGVDDRAASGTCQRNRGPDRYQRHPNLPGHRVFQSRSLLRLCRSRLRVQPRIVVFRGAGGSVKLDDTFMLRAG